MSNPNSTSNEKRVDPVVDAYRQASTREGAGPSAAVRAAVLAHARVVADANATGAPSAHYIAPKDAAANDHSWMWRATAGLVLGVLGVLMFQWMRPNGSATETSVASAPVVVPAAPAVVPAAPTTPVAATPLSETVAAQSPEPRSSTPPTASTSAPAPVSTDPSAAEKLALARSTELAADRARASAKSTVIEPKSVREDRIAATTAMNAAKTAKAQAPASDSVASAAPAAASPMPAVTVAAAAPPPSAAPASPPAASPMPSTAIGASAAVAAAAAAPRYEIAARGDIAMATPKRAPAGNAERTQVAGDTGNAIDSFAKKSVSKPQFENTEARRPSASAVASVGAQGAADAPRARDSFGAAPAAKASVAPSTRETLSAIDAELLRAIRLNDLDAVRAAVARGANVNARDDAGRSALQIARADDLSAMVDLLVALGAR